MRNSTPLDGSSLRYSVASGKTVWCEWHENTEFRA